jgi:ankyrin repeat protein
MASSSIESVDDTFTFEELESHEAKLLSDVYLELEYPNAFLEYKTDGVDIIDAIRKGVHDGCGLAIFDVLKYLPASKDINALGTNGLGVLHSLSKSSPEPVMIILKNSKADVNNRDANSMTPLHHAAFSGHYPLVTILLDRGGDVNSLDKAKKTPLHYGAKYTAATERLLSANADIRARDAMLRTPLHYAAFGGASDAIALFLKVASCEIDATDFQGWTALLIAVLVKQVKTVRVLLKAGARVDSRISIKGVEETTALHLAVIQGNEAIVKLLLDHGAVPDAKDALGRTPFHYPKNCMSLQVIVKGILDKGLLNKSLIDKSIPVKRLIDMQDQTGRTPMHYAVEEKFVETIKFLLKEGASRSIKDFAGRTPKEQAIEKGYTHIANIL